MSVTQDTPLALPEAITERSRPSVETRVVSGVHPRVHLFMQEHNRRNEDEYIAWETLRGCLDDILAPLPTPFPRLQMPTRFLAALAEHTA